MRERALNDAPIGNGPVVYWMTSQRRLAWNHALDHAIARARELKRGLVILEPLRADYPYACTRFHAFIKAGMEQHDATCQRAGIPYHAYIEPEAGAAKGLLAAYAQEAALVVADDHPGFFFPKMLAAAARLPVRMEAVDSVGVLPLSCSDKPFVSAYQFRRHMQKQLPANLHFASPDPLSDAPAGELPKAAEAWDNRVLPHFPKDVPASPIEGGQAQQRLDDFMRRLDEYGERNHPDAEAQSGLSPDLHYGHIGAEEVVARVLEEEDWSPRWGEPKGKRAGWWGLSEGAEAFLDQIVTWRELGHVEARYNPRWMQYRSLPAWARATLEAHETDRDAPYTLRDLEKASTDDEVWNAAQRQLLEEGIIHNYLRMLWGKKILEWAPSARKALDWMLTLNDRYALDGRDPNSVSGIFWCLGRYDRPWQERPVFGKVRCMTSASAKRKLRMDSYLARWGRPFTPEEAGL